MPLESGKRTSTRRPAGSEGLARNLFDLIQQEYGSAEWYPVAIEISGIGPDNLTSDAFEKFDRMRHYTVGNVLYHRAGWGEGMIERFDSDRRELEVRFASGRQQEFPLTSALDSLRPLPPEDLRAMRLREPEELERLAKEEPATLIRKTVQVMRGRATSAQVKSVLVPDIVAQKKWATFWKKAKTAAAHDPWLKIEGSSTRPTFVLRKQPLSLADEAKRSLTHASTLGEVISTCHDYLGRGLDESAQEIIVELARERVEAAIEKQNESPANLLDGILFLEEHGASASMSAAEELRALLTATEDGAVRHPQDRRAVVPGVEGARGAAPAHRARRRLGRHLHRVDHEGAGHDPRHADRRAAGGQAGRGARRRVGEGRDLPA